jgi:hypothetical protein
MSQEDFEDLNVINLTETKSQRAPTFESIPPYPPSRPTQINWLEAAFVGGVAALIAVAVLSLIPRHASRA